MQGFWIQHQYHFMRLLLLICFVGSCQSFSPFSSMSTSEDNKQNKPTSTVVSMNDVLFQCIERNQKKFSVDNDIGFGRMLDAGTGSHSLRWIASLIHNSDNCSSSDKSLHISHYTAITADQNMKNSVLKEAKSLNIENKGDVIIGNWKDESLLQDEELYDTILADYLVGAIDGFSPYFQDLIFERLARHLKPGGKLFVVGLNPIPDKVMGDADVFCKVTKLRDACILLAGHRCYREYPPDWIERHLERADLKVLDTSKYDIMYSHSAIVRQLNVARSKLPLFPTKGLANEMEKAINDLEEESKRSTDKAPNNRLRLGYDYVITAVKK